MGISRGASAAISAAISLAAASGDAAAVTLSRSSGRSVAGFVWSVMAVSSAWG
ncbi:hypothetical protein QWZ10_14205 [Paracoccus cavernae]|uniref:Secreted protein n=1 Tax=Paracoccus cavernae TaxID=1571207 RepID=A0ABT8D9P0_9RHOB|nr:hypothetical protein [Paracoccus cavernae]